MALVTRNDVEQYAGFSYTEFTQNGQQMSQAQWIDFIDSLIPKVTQMIHRYCKVISFEPVPFTEYHSGKGPTNFDTAISDYNLEDQTFFLHQLYADSLVVQVDMSAKNGPPVWATRLVRPTGPQYEQDTILVMSPPAVNGNITITLNSTFTYNVPVLTTMSISDVCAAIVAAGPQTDLNGITWTPSGTSPYVVMTANKLGTQIVVGVNGGPTGTAIYVYSTINGSIIYGGDYEIYQENDVTRVVFYQNIPACNQNNIRFTYNTGYPLGSIQLNDIKFQALRAINNVLLTKKKIQEASTIRNFGVRDYSQMFDAFSEGVVLDDRIKAGLDQYRRSIVPGQFAYE